MAWEDQDGRHKSLHWSVGHEMSLHMSLIMDKFSFRVTTVRNLVLNVIAHVRGSVREFTNEMSNLKFSRP